MSYFPLAVFILCGFSAFNEFRKVWEMPASQRELSDAWPIAWRGGLAIWAACLILGAR